MSCYFRIVTACTGMCVCSIPAWWGSKVVISQTTHSRTQSWRGSTLQLDKRLAGMEKGVKKKKKYRYIHYLSVHFFLIYFCYSIINSTSQMLTNIHKQAHIYSIHTLTRCLHYMNYASLFSFQNQLHFSTLFLRLFHFTVYFSFYIST